MNEPRYPDVPGHVKGSGTSADAARSMIIEAGTMRARILEEMRSLGRGVTCDELEQLLDYSHQTTSARIRELCMKGLIIDSGERAQTRSGRSARLYVVKPAQTELSL